MNYSSLLVTSSSANYLTQIHRVVLLVVVMLVCYDFQRLYEIVGSSSKEGISYDII